MSLGLQVGIPRETSSGERRVAATPDTVERLQKLGFTVAIERGAGARAGHADDRYAEAGAAILDTAELWHSSGVLLKVRAPTFDGPEPEIERTHKGQILISFIHPGQNKPLLDKLAERGVTALAMDAVPRISRAQKMDALSSMANIAGYRAIIEAAHAFPRLFAGQITAAGKMPPAKVLIIGAGVAGLAAIGAARALGAIVRAFDTRPVVKEQVHSMGAEFLEVDAFLGGHVEDGTGQGGYAKEMSKAFIDAEMALFRAQAREVDVIITTALIPGKPAPKLILRDMVEAMRPGSVIVDLAAEQGGNCELTRPGERVDSENGVAVLGFTDLPSRMAAQASQLYGTNLVHLLDDMTRPYAPAGERSFRVDLDDEIVRGATVAHEGRVTWPPPAPPAPPTTAPTSAPTTALAPSKPAYPAEPATPVTVPKAPPSTAGPPTALAAAASGKAVKHGAHGGHATAHAPSTWPLLLAGLALVGVGVAAPPAFLGHLIVFVLACFVGYQVIWNVTPALHTPLMSVTNAISGIILVGGLLHASDGISSLPVSTALGAVAILIATINIAGGFLVTHRMLKMFRRGDR
jgi:H+-translocating NAD(P) transhydrogenase subunit alpha